MADSQVLEWLRARQALKTAVEQLHEIRRRAERAVDSLERWTTVLPDGDVLSAWPDSQTVKDALKACHEAKLKLDQAAGALTPKDRKLLEHELGSAKIGP